MYIENVKYGIRVNILVVVGGIFLFLLNGVSVCFVMLLAAAVHELGHILCALLCKAKIARLDIELWGGRMLYCGSGLSYRQELFIATGGITANLLAAPLGLLIPITGIYGQFFFFCCFAYAIVNIIPAASLDGGVALGCLLRMAADGPQLLAAERIVNAFSLFLIICTGAVLCYISGSNSSVLFLTVLTVVLIAEK